LDADHPENGVLIPRRNTHFAYNVVPPFLTLMIGAMLRHV